QHPLLRLNGCTGVYGPQKGLKAEDFEFAERCLEQLAHITAIELDVDCAEEPGAGAAGGLGFGLRCFAGAQLEPGFALFARYARLEERVRRSQLVITGEGAVDASTIMGKGVGELARLCRQAGLPCLALCGFAPDPLSAKQFFTDIYAMTPDFTNREQATSDPAVWLEKL